jgi:UPF0716 protein FxsA
MRLLGLTAILLVVLGVTEVVVFVLLAKAIGLLWAVLIAIVTSIIGFVLLRREGARGWRRFRSAVNEGRPPGREGVDGVVGLIGALLLLSPGFITDVLGLVLLAPPARAAARAGVRRFAERRISPSVAGQVFGPRQVRVRRQRNVRIDESPTVVAEPPPPSSGASGRPPEAIEGEIVE